MPESTYPRTALQHGGVPVPPLALGSWNTWDRMSKDEAVALIREPRSSMPDSSTSRTTTWVRMPRTRGPTSCSARRCGRAASIATDNPVRQAVAVGLAEPGFRPQLVESLGRAGLERFDTVVVGDYGRRPTCRASSPR